MSRIVIFILFFHFAFFQLSAQDVKAFIIIEKNQALIGDHIKTTLTVETKQGRNVEFPVLANYFKDEKIEILNLSNIEKSSTNGWNKILKQSFSLVFWDSGKYVIPVLPFAYTDGENVDSIYTQELVVNVKFPDGITGDTSYLAPIKPILEEKKNLWDYFLDYSFVIYGILVILLIAIILYFVLKKLRDKRLKDELLTPEAKAIQSLNKLLEADYSKKGQHALYHEGISIIVRTYLNEKFGLKALESITSDILQDVASLDLDEQLKLELKELLETADLVKYAKASPLPAADKFAAEYIYRLVESALEKQKALSENNK